ncbi:PadR family transcriptional regulator, regulatory protein PadR [Gracilibacillus orientalis]|uniref:PadR family transcriptional regulator, regulatory protein PadR n=1 Tax=Gracilibacillus orientalis TaxID=334253 RepID=A0A1I4LS56_9BACI|nr:PadR family transcriptional regulator [Gracilibacillus orientalis]SFL93417.1 PadR family transcriptional regulator, regulatory protein PadR [Gracilibacillus orientalis]
MAVRSQLLKGILEGCILAIIASETVYGYELAMKLQNQGLDVSEGSIYPILLRLQKEKLIQGEMKKSPSGPNRKYYTLTDAGKESLLTFRENWENVKKPVDQLLRSKEEL